MTAERRNNPDQPLTDLHAHLLPGLDDGPASMDAALEAARGLVADGISMVICTPHLALGQYDNLRDPVIAATRAMQSRLDAAGIGLRLFPGCEALAHPDLPRLLAAGKLATLADRGRHVLLEIPWTLLAPAVPALDRLLEELNELGVQVILAHPERYELVHKHPGWLAERVEKGMLVQVNAAHLLPGQAGTTARTARTLLQEGLVHFIGSDGHGNTRRPFNLGSTLRVLSRHYHTGVLEQAAANALSVVEGLPSPPPPIKV